jgi:hypothetical protein
MLSILTCFLWVGLAFVGFGDDVMIGASELNDVALKDGELMIYLCEQFQDPITPSINIYYWLRNALSTCKKLTIKNRSKQQLILLLLSGIEPKVFPSLKKKTSMKTVQCFHA